MTVPHITIIVSIDTEEDSWIPSLGPVTTDNIRELPRVQAFFARLGVRATYFTTYQVAAQASSAAIMREIGGGRVEIGAHLHPWNTPPAGGPLRPGASMLLNLAPEVQRAKLERLTGALFDMSGARPASFRAGRFGFGAATAAELLRSGYTVDSSVTPFFSWEGFDGGPSFVGAPNGVYRLGDGDVRVPADRGTLVEVPISCGYNRWPMAAWQQLNRLLHGRTGEWRVLASAASHLGVARRVMLSPERDSLEDMLALSRRLIAGRVPFLHMFWHSSSLRPGLTPFMATGADVERLYATVERLLEGLSRLASLTFATISEAAAALAPPPHA